MGPTKVFKTIYEQPETIRGTYGTTDTRNATHGSGVQSYFNKFNLIFFNFIIFFQDSIENSKLEIKFFFPEFQMEKWFAEEEEYFANNNVKFDEMLIEHKPLIKKA